MKLSSHVAVQRAVQCPPQVFETVVGNRTHTVAIGEGQVAGNDIHLLDEDDADSLESLAALTQLQHPDRMIRFAELDGLATVEERMAKVFDALEDGAPVMFLCRSGEIREAAREALHVAAMPPVWQH